MNTKLQEKRTRLRNKLNKIRTKFDKLQSKLDTVNVAISDSEQQIKWRLDTEDFIYIEQDSSYHLFTSDTFRGQSFIVEEPVDGIPVVVWSNYRHATAGDTHWGDMRIVGTWEEITEEDFKRISDPFYDLKEAQSYGAQIDYRRDDGTWDTNSLDVCFHSSTDRYRIHDPLREYKEAYAAGKVVEWRDDIGRWSKVSAHCAWVRSYEYRIQAN